MLNVVPETYGDGRSPHGERGLKWLAVVTQMYYEASLPTPGAGIENYRYKPNRVSGRVAPHTGSVD